MIIIIGIVLGIIITIINKGNIFYNIGVGLFAAVVVTIGIGMLPSNNDDLENEDKDKEK